MLKSFFIEFYLPLCASYHFYYSSSCMQKKGFWNTLIAVLINKYSFVLVIFFGYLIFFDNHSLIRKSQTRKEIYKLQEEHQYYLDKIQEDKSMIKRLYTDTVFLEKYARENYLMKKDNEDIFIFKEPQP